MRAVLTTLRPIVTEATAVVLVGLGAWAFLNAMGAPYPTLLAPSILALSVYLSR